MVEQILLAQPHKVALPRRVHFSTVFGLRHPLASVLVIAIEAIGVFVMLFYTRLLDAAVLAVALMLAAGCLLMLLLAGRSISSSGILNDLVDFVGLTESKIHFANANRDVTLLILPSAIFGLLPAVVYFWEVHDQMSTVTEAERVIIYCSFALTTMSGPFLGVAVVCGPVELMRMVAALLKGCIGKHFAQLEAAMAGEGLSAEERLDKLDVHCKRVKQLFEKANKCITRTMFTAVVTAYLAALVFTLEIVLSTRVRRADLVAITFGTGSVLFITFGTSVLHCLTTVADHYEDLASDFIYDLVLRFKITSTFPGPAGVHLLTSFESELVNDLSFNFHHTPLDARTLQNTMVKLFLGAMMTVVLGVLT